MIKKVMYQPYAAEISPLEFDVETGVMYIKQKTGCKILSSCRIMEDGRIRNLNNYYLKIDDNCLMIYDIKKLKLKKKIGGKHDRYYIDNDNALVYEQENNGKYIEFMLLNWFIKTMDFRQDGIKCISWRVFSYITSKPYWWKSPTKKILIDSGNAIDLLSSKCLTWMNIEEIIIFFTNKNWLSKEEIVKYLIINASKTRIGICSESERIDKMGKIVKI